MYFFVAGLYSMYPLCRLIQQPFPDVAFRHLRAAGKFFGGDRTGTVHFLEQSEPVSQQRQICAQSSSKIYDNLSNERLQVCLIQLSLSFGGHYSGLLLVQFAVQRLSLGQP